MRRAMIASGALMALAASGMLAASPSFEPDADHTPAPATIRTRHKPSGSQPVAGGGTKQRVKLVVRDVRAWIKGVHAEDGEVGKIDLCAYLQKNWPDLPQPVWAGVLAAFGFIE